MALAPERAALLYAHHGAPGDLAFEVGGKSARKLIEINGAGDDAREVPGAQVGRDAPPHRQSPLAPGGRGVDADQRHAAQDEGHDGGLELRPAGEADARDVAPEVHGPGEPREDIAPHVVDGPAEAGGLERPGAEVYLLPGEDLRCAECLEIARRRRLTAHRTDTIAKRG